MKKMKGVAAAAAPVDSSFPYVSGYEDPRARLRFQNLLQDYEDLYKETEANRSRLEMMRQKKTTLLAEVRFLRRRYKYLTQTQSQYPSAERDYDQRQKVATGGKNARKDKNSTGNGAAALRPPVPRFDLNQKGKTHSERETIFRSPAPNSVVMNKKQKAYSGKETALRNSLMIPDLNQKERIYSGKEATARNVTPIFDLNQISREEEEFQENSEAMRIEEPKISSIRGGGVNDDQHNDIKLSACRNIGNGSSQAGKRKISWQDQVALRV